MILTGGSILISGSTTKGGCTTQPLTSITQLIINSLDFIFSPLNTIQVIDAFCHEVGGFRLGMEDGTGVGITGFRCAAAAFCCRDECLDGAGRFGGANNCSSRASDYPSYADANTSQTEKSIAADKFANRSDSHRLDIAHSPVLPKRPKITR